MKLRLIDWITIAITIIPSGGTIWVYFTIEDRGIKAAEKTEELVIPLKQ